MSCIVTHIARLFGKAIKQDGISVNQNLMGALSPRQV